ncbi:MAG: hypothetical protein GY898_08515 [Proteobacteria bacterium]|nr:hypothetical protein [Pseudomonadota bacterium]
MRSLAAAVGAALLLLPATAAAGPWTPEPGGGYAKVWLHWLPGFGYNPGPEAADDGIEGPQLYGVYNEVAVGTYAELGLVDGVALAAHWMPVRTFLLGDPRAGSPAKFHASIGEPLVGIKVRPVQYKRFVLGFEGAIRAPTGRNRPVQEVYGIADGNPLIGALRIDSGSWDATVGTSAGLGFDRWYGAASAAWTWRSEGFDSVLSWSIEAGRGSLGKKGLWSGRVRIAGNHPLGDGTADYHASPSGLGNGSHYIGFTLEVERAITPGWWVGLSLAGGLVPVLRQTGGPAITVSLAHTF